MIPANLSAILYLISGVLFILALSGLSSPETSRQGNFFGILGMIIAPVVMILIYFFILTPVSLIVRIFGKDLLGLKFLKESESYWIKRKKKLGSMRKQF